MMEYKSSNENKKTYEKPEIEIMVFETEKICFSGLGESFGMDGIGID